MSDLRETQDYLAEVIVDRNRLRAALRLAAATYGARIHNKQPRWVADEMAKIINAALAGTAETGSAPIEPGYPDSDGLPPPADDALDAARYRWLREHTVATGLSQWMGRHQFLDAAVDAARDAVQPAAPASVAPCPITKDGKHRHYPDFPGGCAYCGAADQPPPAPATDTIRCAHCAATGQRGALPSGWHFVEFGSDPGEWHCPACWKELCTPPAPEPEDDSNDRCPFCQNVVTNPCDCAADQPDEIPPHLCDYHERADYSCEICEPRGADTTGAAHDPIIHAQQEETARTWMGPRSQLPPRYFEVCTDAAYAAQVRSSDTTGERHE